MSSSGRHRLAKVVKSLSPKGWAAAGVAALALIGSTTAAVAFTASAAVNGPQYNSIGTAGYDAIGGPFSSVGATVTTDAPALNIGTVGTGGLGVQMCDPNNGFVLQEGEVATSPTSFSVDYQAGSVAGAASDNCVGNGVLKNPLTLNANLTGLPVGATVNLYVHFRTERVAYKIWVGRGRHRHFYWGHKRVGKALFQAYDASTFELYSKTITTPVEYFDNDGAGVEQNTTLVSANSPALCPKITPVTSGACAASDGTPSWIGTGGSGASNPLATFAAVTVDPFGIFSPSSHGITDGVSNEVVSSAGSLHGNPAVVAPNNSESGGGSSTQFTVSAGNPIG